MMVSIVMIVVVCSRPAEMDENGEKKYPIGVYWFVAIGILSFWSTFIFLILFTVMGL
jgi:hypothetical protein